jgi:hypothetical protein
MPGRYPAYRRAGSNHENGLPLLACVQWNRWVLPPKAGLTHPTLGLDFIFYFVYLRYALCAMLFSSQVKSCEKEGIAVKWKWIIGGFCAFIVVLVVAAYVIVSTYNYNSLKPEIARAVKDETGRELTLGGNISLKIGFTPALVVQDVSFQNASWGSQPNLARIKRF